MNKPNNTCHPAQFVKWFRTAAPYIHGFRKKTFVIAFGGEVVDDGLFVELTHDFNLLNSLGVRLVLVHGVRPQVETRLKEINATIKYVDGLRVTDAAALTCVKEAVGIVRVEIEALLSQGLANSPMAGADIRVASGNFVTAKPGGVWQGVDLEHTGEVRKVDAAAINESLASGAIVLLSPLGYSPTGEVFNLTLEDVATSAAIALKAEKLIFLMDAANDALPKTVTTAEAAKWLKAQKRPTDSDLDYYLPCAIDACRGGVNRVHLINRHTEGGLLQELFTHEGVGSMIANEPVETLRKANIDDVGAILQLIEPLEQAGILVRRGRERLEMEVELFYILEHDGMVIGCAALYPYPDAAMGELACLAVHPDYRNSGRGERLFDHMQVLARNQGLTRLFTLTTRTEHWFVERGFKQGKIDDLPTEKQELYNYQRRSKVFVKQLG